jgi:hypothetical protein
MADRISMIFFQLGNSGLDIPGEFPVTAVRNGLIFGIAQYFGRGFALDITGLDCKRIPPTLSADGKQHRNDIF